MKEKEQSSNLPCNTPQNFGVPDFERRTDLLCPIMRDCFIGYCHCNDTTCHTQFPLSKHARVELRPRPLQACVQRHSKRAPSFPI